MIQVPMFGMENNPDSLQARRRAFLTSYGYPLEDINNPERVDELTEVVGYVPTGDYPPALVYDMADNAKFRLTFYSCVTPYTRAWLTVPGAEAQETITLFERCGLWQLYNVQEISNQKDT